MTEQKVVKKQSSTVLNIIIIIIGILYLVIAVFDFLAWANIYTPAWLNNPDLAVALSLFGASGLISALLGFWCFIGGIGLFREEEYALGIALVVLSIMAVQFITKIINWATIGFDGSYWPNYIIIIAGATGIVGFFYLLFTYKRYD